MPSVYYLLKMVAFEHFHSRNFFIGGVFIVIFVGIALAIITLIVEYWYYKYKKPNSSVDVDILSKQLQVKQQLANAGSKTEYGLKTSTDPATAATVPTIDKNWWNLPWFEF